MEAYAYGLRALRGRTDYAGDFGSGMVLLTAPDGQICRILHNCGNTVVFVQAERMEKLTAYLSKIDLVRELQNPEFCQQLLGLFGLDPAVYVMEPEDELVEARDYPCSHIVEFTCSRETFIPFLSDVYVTEIHRGNKDYMQEEPFYDTMYGVYDGDRVVADSSFRPNVGEFAGTYALQVYTRPEARGQGYATAVASAATHEICRKSGLALWVCQIENVKSAKIAQRLGYAFLGGEIRINEP